MLLSFAMKIAKPPLISIFAPVMNEVSDEAKQATVFAISSEEPSLRSGVIPAIFSRISSLVQHDVEHEVIYKPYRHLLLF